MQAELGKLRIELNQARKQLDERKASIADKAARKTQADKLARFLHDGETIKLKCFNGLTISPQTHFSDWLNQLHGYMKTEMDSSHLVMFMDTPAPNMRTHYQVEGKPVTKECNDTAKAIDMKLAVLRDFLSELNK